MEDIAEIDLERQGNAAYELLRELRTALSEEDFREVFEEAHLADDYRLWGAFVNGRLVGLMGARRLTDYVHGRHLYIDDLVVTKEQRSAGVGARLLQFAEAEARRQGCRGLRLCTGVENEAGRRFYEREGWQARSLAYKKRL